MTIVTTVLVDQDTQKLKGHSCEFRIDNIV